LIYNWSIGTTNFNDIDNDNLFIRMLLYIIIDYEWGLGIGDWG